MQVAHSPFLVLAVTKTGGHLGWFEHTADGRVRRWYVPPVVQFLTALVEVSATHSIVGPNLTAFVDGNGSMAYRSGRSQASSGSEPGSYVKKGATTLDTRSCPRGRRPSSSRAALPVRSSRRSLRSCSRGGNLSSLNARRGMQASMVFCMSAHSRNGAWPKGTVRAKRGWVAKAFSMRSAPFGDERRASRQPRCPLWCMNTLQGLFE